MSSPTQGAWECRHGVDARDWCSQCHGNSDAPCDRCSFIPTGGSCLCRAPAEDDVPLWGDA